MSAAARCAAQTNAGGPCPNRPAPRPVRTELAVLRTLADQIELIASPRHADGLNRRPLTRSRWRSSRSSDARVSSTAGYGAGFHAHMGVAFADGTMHGGHLFEVHVSPTLELELTASPVAIHRAFDESFKTWLLVP